ncbi:MAG: hypothetical protein EPO32_12875 [Anaerolineae bacterium]|nr:MAG: hypothetical protein EPO32_12875 [Anaerolineae bacterium]
MPGKTTLATAQDLLQPVAFDFSKIGPFQYYVSFPYIQKIRFPEEWEQSYRFHIFRARVGANVVEQIYVPYYGDEKLAELIREYGKPRGVYYWSNGIDIGGSSSILIVDYSHRGILFVIDELSKLANANQGSYVVQTCPDKNTERNVALWLIAPSISPDHSNIADLYMDITGWLIELKSIETVTNVSADAIYQFALSETEFCFESALENWGDFRFGPTATP